ncbi:hypothetical protein [Pseudomonas kilonensis]|uniref:hypothetical protein n=1 Tax=Pseudomonas kilonensis TaxID=132476 RepID=UPI0020A22CEE|nr:hypothetical protein [Pseudomonas kilonensis]MCP1454577.1 hypothetical protein [Pseudomonas kilonensis]
MDESEDVVRINQEWLALNALRAMVKIATKGDMTKGTYENTLELGGELYPELLGPEHSLLRRERESDTVKEFRQRANLLSVQQERNVAPVELLQVEIDLLKSLLEIAKLDRDNQSKTDQLKRKLAVYEKAKEELSPAEHTENKLIFRDAYNADRELPTLGNGLGRKDYQLPDGNRLRLRVLHPDKPEHITGADVIYERHDELTQTVNLVVVQYKIWDGKKLYLSDERLQGQLARLKCFTCDQQLCKDTSAEQPYRFPHCSAFLRPTDKLQSANQKLISRGEHLPLCNVDRCKSLSRSGGYKLEYDKIKPTSLTSELFEHMFNRGKIGSRALSYEELEDIYRNSSIIDRSESVVVYAQEY